MKVRIKGDISGSRDGQPWPKRGEVMDLPDDEGAALCASGLAAPVADDGDVEKAVPDDDSEKRVLTTDNAAAVTASSAESKDPAPTPVKKTAAKRAAAKPAQGEDK